MNSTLIDQICALLRSQGKLKTQEIVDALNLDRRVVTNILEENHYTFDFEIDFSGKFWKLNN